MGAITQIVFTMQVMAGITGVVTVGGLIGAPGNTIITENTTGITITATVGLNIIVGVMSGYAALNPHAHHTPEQSFERADGARHLLL